MDPLRRAVPPLRIVSVPKRSGILADALHLLVANQLLARRLRDKGAAFALAHQCIDLLREFPWKHDVYTTS